MQLLYGNVLQQQLEFNIAGMGAFMKTFFIILLLHMVLWANTLEHEIVSSNRTQFTFAPKGLIAVVSLDKLIKSRHSEDTDDLKVIYGYNSEGFKVIMLYIMDSRIGRAEAYASIDDISLLKKGIDRYYKWAQVAKEKQVKSFQKAIPEYEKYGVGLIFNVDSNGKCSLQIRGVGIKSSYSGIILNPQKLADAIDTTFSKKVFTDLWNTRIKRAQKAREIDEAFK